MHLALSVVQSYAERHQQSSRPITPKVVTEENEELVVNELEGVWLDRAALSHVNNRLLPHGTTPPVPMHRNRLLSSRPNSSTSNPINASSARSTPMHALTHRRFSTSPSIHSASRNTIERQQGRIIEKRVTGVDDCPVCQQLLLPSDQQNGFSLPPGVCLAYLCFACHLLHYLFRLIIFLINYYHNFIGEPPRHLA